MLQKLYILLICFLAANNAFSQPSQKPKPSPGSNTEERPEKPTVQNPDTTNSTVSIYGWKLGSDNISVNDAPIDTLLKFFQIHNVVNRKYHSLSYNGSNASAYLPNLFFERRDWDDLIFLNSYYDYFNTYDNTIYLNTHKPFSELYYSQSWPSSNEETQLSAFHSQNVNPNFNVGFSIDFLKDYSHYKYENTSNKKFKFFSSYIGDNYSNHASINLNRYVCGESGGIIDTNYYSGNWQLTKEIETNFTGESGSGNLQYVPDVTNSIRYFDGMMSQSLNIFTFGHAGNDSTKASKTIAQPVISHVILFRRVSKVFENSDSTNNSYFDNVYSNNETTYDSISELKITNKLQLDFKTKINNNVLAGVFGSISHDFIKYNYYSKIDTSKIRYNYYNKLDTNGLSSEEIEARTEKYLNKGVPNYDTLLSIDKRKKINNIYVNAGIYGKFWSQFESKFYGTIYLTGYKAGQTSLNGEISTKIKLLKQPFNVDFEGALENLVPSYQFNSYYSNNYIWENDFKNINRIYLSGKIETPSKRFEVEGNYSLLSNYIYMSDDGPESYNNPISVSAFSVKKEFVIWKFHSINQIWLQISENSSVIEVPGIVFFNSTYFDQTWLFKLTNGKLRTMLGVDINYNSAFNGYRYNPSVAQYYISNNTYSVGNYPYIDAWLNVRLKRARLYAKYEHVNSSDDNLNHFYAVNYPSKLGVFKIGLSWTFYN